MADPNLKLGWKTYRFDQIAISVNDRVEPDDTDLQHYVGLEHLDTDSLKIRRWGTPDDVGATKLRFRKGDIIFGRRRVYQRKLAVADFDGICSAHAMVLRPRTDVVLPEFLPFFMQSELFMNRALEISVGSLSPTINWKTLAAQEFPLPPLAEQRRLAEVLEACNNVTDSYHHALKQAEIAALASLNSVLVGSVSRSELSEARIVTEIALPSGWHFRAAQELCLAPVTSGSTPRRGITDGNTGMPFIRVQNLTNDGRLRFEANPKYLEGDAFSTTSSQHVVPGDVLTNIVGPPLGKISVIPRGFPESQINQAIVRYRPENESIGLILLGYLLSDWAKHWLFSRSKKTSGQRNISSTTCAVLPVPLPPPGELNSLALSVKSLLEMVQTARNRQQSSNRFREHTLNSIL